MTAALECRLQSKLSMSAIPTYTYQPFKDYSSWFSDSVEPKFIKQWSKFQMYFGGKQGVVGHRQDSGWVHMYTSCMSLCAYNIYIYTICYTGLYGGQYATSAKLADFLFSESSTTSDTLSLYQSGSNLCVFRPHWITAVIEAGGDLSNVLIAKYILLPAYCITPTTNNDYSITCNYQLQRPFNQKVENLKHEHQNIKTCVYSATPLKYKRPVNSSSFATNGRTNHSNKSSQVQLQTDEKHIKGCYTLYAHTMCI